VTATSPLSALQSVWSDALEAVGSTIGVGIDLVEVVPVRELIDAGGSAFVDAAWSRGEQTEANGQAEVLAGKWAVKEAVMKALQHGIGELDPCDIEVLTTDAGAPRIELHQAARTFALDRKIAAWHVSLTHEEGWAAAIVIASPRHLWVADGFDTTEGGGING
jgi:holo-[acyl-carrier protein] synthase